MSFYVYVYLDSRKPGDYQYGNYQFDYEPFYIGKGKEERDKFHLTCLNNNINKPLYSKIRKIKRETNNIPIILRIKEGMKEAEAYKFEIDMISYIGRKNMKSGPLVNQTFGGGNSPETEQKIKQTRLLNGHPMQGKSHSIKSKIKMSNSQIGNKNRAERFKVITPNGDNSIIKNLKEFCRVQSMNYFSVKSCVNRGTPMRTGYLFERVS